MVALAHFTYNTGRTLVVPSARYRPAGKTRLTNKDRDRIAEAYAGGLSFAEVAEQEGVARSTVMRIVRSRGVEVRPWGLHY